MLLSLLTEVFENNQINQTDLAVKLKVSVGSINSYLKRLVYKGYVKTTQLNRRNLKYVLTQNGIKEKTRLTYEFLTWSYQYIKLLRNGVKEKLLPLTAQGKNRVVLYGSGEVVEIAYLAVLEVKAELVGIVNHEHVGKRCMNHTILSFEELASLENVDVILVLQKDIPMSSFEEIQAISKKLIALLISCC